MRKTIFTLFTAFLLYGGTVGAQNISNCATEEYTEMLKEANPQAFEADRQEFEQGWRNYAATQPTKQQLGKKAEKIIIPVVFHIFHDYGSENLTDAQVAKILSDLNKYYNADASLVSGVRAVFQGDIANCNFEFRLARKDPNGNCTNGIVRVQTNLTYKANNAIKELSTWDTKRYLNIWTAKEVFSNGRAVGGYAQLAYSGMSSTDGLLVVATQALNGNTVAHEIGHSMGLLHPFEGSESDSCSNGDGVDDTPRTYFRYAVGGVNSGRGNFCGDSTYNSCGNEDPDKPDMQENIMDYFDGPCSGVMFTLGQEARMRFCIETYRSKLVSQENLVSTGVLDPVSACAPIAAFGLRSGSVNTLGRNICTGVAVNFVDQSYNGTPTSWEWNFGDGATPGTSTSQNPTGVSYSTPGLKTVTLKVTNAQGTDTKTFTSAVNVITPVQLTYHAYGPDYPTTTEGWELTGDDKGVNWRVSDVGVFSGERSLMLPANNALATMFGKQYIITSPFYDISNASNPYFSFKYAFARNYYPGSSSSATLDNMKVQISSNCGLTWDDIRSINENSIGTITSPLNYTVNFVPVNQTTGTGGQWKLVNVNVTSTFKKANVRFRILFESGGGNNLYIDEIQMGQNTGLKELSAEEIGLSIFPNPFSASATINYTLPKSDNVNIEVFDLVGKKITTLFNGKQAEGAQNVTFDRTQFGLSTGMYFVKINVGNSFITQKVMVN